MRALPAMLLIAAWLLAACATPTLSPPDPTVTPAATATPLLNTPRPVGASPTPPPTATEPSLFAPVSDADWQLGPKDAVATLIVYDDFQCAFCASLEPILARLRTEFPDDLRVIFRHYPLPQDDKARLAASAAEAAGAQGKFWEMHDLLFARQADWSGLSAAAFNTQLDPFAQQLGLDLKRFDADRASPVTAAKIEQAYQAAVNVPVPGAPFVLFNGEPFQDQGLTDHWALSTLIRLAKLKTSQFAEAPPDVINPFGNYVATLITGKGNIVIQLFAEQAPLTVNNFVFLSQHGWYDGVTFTRVITGFAAQTGDPSGTGYGGPGYFIPDEFVPELKYTGPGWVGMSNAGPNTNGSQFFISLGPLPQFDGKYPLFGKVLSGMEVVQRLTPRDPNQDAEAPPGDAIQTIQIEEK
jgi:cyclophilin family peptidyl-prolyl cis-trans isomerase/protein-disulfide isomerase